MIVTRTFDIYSTITYAYRLEAGCTMDIDFEHKKHVAAKAKENDNMWAFASQRRF